MTDDEKQKRAWMHAHFDELGPLGQEFATDLLFKKLTMAEAVRHFLDGLQAVMSPDELTNFEQGVWREITEAHDKWTNRNVN